ncbi:MAG: hemerythrin domain-containing protein [Sandaracinus sp.]|nr:hemerythrin domain-containing protein [Sandaracinus sp.]MCB9617620.1 hemerythrin domain-containing protein [Sandaracinus sp.]MCB9622893.1 hemerythrin domain-containing protein [Sandaracinus sp.]
MFLDPDLRLQELAFRVCGAEAALHAHAVPLHADQTLREVCRREKIPLEEVLQSLRRIAEGEPEAFGIGGLVRHILREHHDVERREVPRLKGLSAMVARRHGASQPALLQLADLVANLNDELEAHLAREERVLFPYLLELERAARGEAPVPRPRFRSLRHPLRIMSAEHAVEEEMLETLRELTEGYSYPPNADDAQRELIDGLRTFDADLTKHMHLEDGVLYPLALALEARLGIDG